MYYQEKVINGILCCRYAPSGKWIALSKETLTERLMKCNKALGEILSISNDFGYNDINDIASEAISY